MTHAEARELMEALFATPADAGPDAAARGALVAHLAECPDCAREHAALAATAAALQLAYGPPPALRQRVLDAVARTGRDRSGAAAASPSAATGGRLIAFPRALAAAAALAVLAFVAGALSMVYLAPRESDSALAKAAMVMAEMARDPSAHAMTLRDPNGAPGGTVMYAPDSSMLVVFSEMLEEPASGRYDCYLEREGQRTWIGPMLFEDDTAFWAGPVRTDTPPRQGDRFLVLAGPDDPVPMLVASF